MPKLRNLASKYGRKLAAVGAGAVVLAGNASAAVDAAVSTAISDGQADGVKIAGLILAMIIGIGIFRHMRKGT